ncbi:MAG: RDD family protein [Ignavibacteria bacterium]|jgi:uncharacterized RDD family membrane protein YckC|nr:RDD family protein [Ignavibacteria bacterium]MDH7526951.1 RDD family protein [Ignavibacteria bacterium]
MTDQERVNNLSLFFARALAFAVDNLIILLFLIYVYHITNITINENVFFIFLLLIFFELYFAVFECIFHRTPGKLIFGLKVVINRNHASEQNSIKSFLSNFFEILIRNLTRVLAFIPPLFFWNEILIILFSKGKNVRDLFTSTSVDFSKKMVTEIYKGNSLITQNSIEG